MSDEAFDYQDFLELLVETANETDIADADALRRVIDSHDLVYGVWQDAASEHGVGSLIIKGEGKLEVIKYTGMPQEATWTAVKCRCAEEAEAMSRVFGEKSKPV